MVPAYLSFLALESVDKEDDVKYLTYWIIFSIAEVSTPLFKILLSSFVYSYFRIILTLLLLHPLTGFSNKIYYKLVEPFLKKHETTIDQNLSNLAKEGKERIVDGVEEGLKKLS